MIHYMFNNNKPLNFENSEPALIIIHYCHHCNAELIGEWLLGELGKLKATTKETEVSKFVRLTKCPFCCGEFDNKKEHHFSNYVINYHENVGLRFRNKPLLQYSVIKGIYSVGNRENIHYKDLKDLPFGLCPELQEGEKVKRGFSRIS